MKPTFLTNEEYRQNRKEIEKVYDAIWAGKLTLKEFEEYLKQVKSKILKEKYGNTTRKN